MKISKKHDQAFSGIEAAIVLIAFVVVATVFSYVILGAGFFTTQKSQQIAHAEVTQTTSTIAVRGDVIGLDSFHGGNVSIVEFDIGLAEGRSPVDISRIHMSFSTPNQAPTGLTYIPSNGAAVPPVYGMEPGSWTIISSTMQPRTTVLQGAQHATIGVMPPVPLQPREDFNVQIEPENGASLGISRTIPSGVTNTTILY
jgi:archaeal flagellin FlaB